MVKGYYKNKNILFVLVITRRMVEWTVISGTVLRIIIRKTVLRVIINHNCQMGNGFPGLDQNKHVGRGEWPSATNCFGKMLLR